MTAPSAQADNPLARTISHEVGHCVVACALGYPVSRVLIRGVMDAETRFDDPQDARATLAITAGALAQIHADYGHVFRDIRCSDLESARADVARLSGRWHTDDAALFASSDWQAAIALARLVVAEEVPFTAWLQSALAAHPRVYGLRISSKWMELGSDTDYRYLLNWYFRKT